MIDNKPPLERRRKSKRLEKRFMTVCVAALAANRVIVCVADKALSYGDSIQWDSDSTKILKLNPSGSLVMFSGDEEPSSKVLANLIVDAKEIGGGHIRATVKRCERWYKDVVDELIEAKFLTPRLLKRDDYLKALTAPQMNPYIIAVQVSWGLGSALLKCGT